MSGTAVGTFAYARTYGEELLVGLVHGLKAAKHEVKLAGREIVTRPCRCDFLSGRMTGDGGRRLDGVEHAP